MTSANIDIIRKQDTLSNILSGSIREGQKAYTSAGTDYVIDIFRVSGSNYKRWTCDDGQVLLTGNQSISGTKTFSSISANSISAAKNNHYFIFDGSSFSTLSGDVGLQIVLNQVDTEITLLNTSADYFNTRITSAIMKDGSVPFSANQSMGGFGLTSATSLKSTTSFLIDIDSDNNSTSENFVVTLNGLTSNYLFKVKENGQILIGDNDTTADVTLQIMNAHPINGNGNTKVVIVNDSVAMSAESVLQLLDNNDKYLEIKIDGGATGSSYILTDAPTDFQFGAVSNIPVVFKSNNVEVFRCTSGSLGITNGKSLSLSKPSQTSTSSKIYVDSSGSLFISNIQTDVNSNLVLQTSGDTCSIIMKPKNNTMFEVYVEGSNKYLGFFGVVPYSQQTSGAGTLANVWEVLKNYGLIS